ncbi:PH domain-containing protein [Glutamicibacter arilaitensis]|uniref:PH domain-containing protein n=1 Tax=Glutamicibacter arilaitensis TaxID=256701 RepID=UPI003F8DB0A7
MIREISRRLFVPHPSYALYMIDFNNSSVFKLGPWDLSQVAPEIVPMMVTGEELLSAFKGARDYVVFSNKRLIAVNVQGMTGKKRDYTSLPYSKVQSFSVETAGTFDLDAELDLWFSGLGKVRLEFKGKVDVRALSQLIASYVL